MESRKKVQICRGNRDADMENRCVDRVGGRECGVNWGIRIHTYTLPCVGSWGNLLQSTGSSAECSVRTYTGGVVGGVSKREQGCPKGRVYMYTHSLFILLYSRTNTTLQSNYTPILKKKKSTEKGRCLVESEGQVRKHLPPEHTGSPSPPPHEAAASPIVSRPEI